MSTAAARRSPARACRALDPPRGANLVATICSLLQLLAVTAPTDTLGPVGRIGPDPAAVATPDSVPPPRVVRQFPAVEVRALLQDVRSSQTVHPISAVALRSYPVDRLADLVALQPGVVAQGEELHVRGGRAGETLVILDGVTLNEPLRHRPMEVPLFALRSAELVSGTPESRYPGALGGVLQLNTVEPTERVAGEWRWQTDAGLDTRFDRVSAGVSAPLPLAGLGVVAAADALLDNTSLPALRSTSRKWIAGLPLHLRADNRVLGFLKLAPLAGPQRFSAQLLASRTVSRPFDPAWSLDGWSGSDGFGLPDFSPEPLPGYTRYRAADHKATTDDRRVAGIVTAAGVRGTRRGTMTLGVLRTRTATTVGGTHAIPAQPDPARFDPDPAYDPFHVVGGDDPLYRVSGSNVYSLRGDVEAAVREGTAIRVGLGASYEQVWLHELDGTLFYVEGQPIDSVRSYRAWAPGGFAFAQGRWQSGGTVLNAGLRAEYFTPGPQAQRQTLPGRAAGRLSLLPRLGLAFPLSARNACSISYTRVSQVPERDLLYDQRVAITNRQPLGNPSLRPARMISYEAAVKHVVDAEWSLQASVFYRDAAYLAGARDYQTPGGPIDLRYTDEDQASSAGFEVSLVRELADGRRLEAHYTFMHAWGYESRPEGDPYGPVRDVRTAPFGERPLSWDRRHTLVGSGLWRWGGRVSLAWSASIGAPLPWTPKPRRQPLTDLSLVHSRRLGWSSTANVAMTWSPPHVLGLVFGLEARNVFNDRSEQAVTVDGFPNPIINTQYDDYGAYRTETGLGGGAWWNPGGGAGHWVPVHDPRLFQPPRTVRASIGRRW